MRRSFAIIVILLILPHSWAEAALETTNYKCVCATAAGAGTGADWSNCMAFSADEYGQTFTARDTTYYLADGSFGAWNFVEIAQNGTQRIILKKATEAEHGTATGWTSSMGDGTADFTYIRIDSARFEIDGVTGSDTSGYGIRIHQNLAQCEVGVGSSLVIIHSYYGVNTEYCKISNTEVYYDVRRNDCDYRGIYFVGGSNHSVMNNYVHDTGSDALVITTGQQIIGNVLARNGSGATVHGQMLLSAGGADNVVIAYNKFLDCSGMCIFNSDGTASNWKIYNNLFYQTIDNPVGVGISTLIATRSGVQCETYAEGCNTSIADNWEIYNNTVAGILAANTTGVAVNDHDVFSEFHIYNNLWWNNTSVQFYGNAGTTWDCDYNYFSSNSAVGGYCSGANNQTPSNQNPFTGSSSYIFTLSATNDAKGTGDDKSEVFTDDILKNTRVAWDIGAYEWLAPQIGGAVLSGAVVK